MNPFNRKKMSTLLLAAGVIIGTACLTSVIAQTIPAGYRLDEDGEINGDLNGDGVDDRVLVIKSNTKSKKGCDCESSDCKRRGIMIFFKEGGGYKLALEKRDCFSAGDGLCGNYGEPQLQVSIKKGNLYIRYDFGRYGWWQYTFRYRNSDFELIGYDESSLRMGWEYKTESINILSKKMLVKKNKSGDDPPDDWDGENPKPSFNEFWHDIIVKGPIKLRNLADFDVTHFNLIAKYVNILFTDKRDGKVYRTVEMPDGKTWMAENLNYQTGGSWCYGNDNSKCDKYGRLYNWKTAKSVCQSGWHLPSREEWVTLVNAAGSSTAGKKLKAKSGWNNVGSGEDAYGFSALPGGLYYNSDFDDAGNGGYWWTATENGSGNMYYRGMGDDYDGVIETALDSSGGFSVRCVMD
jgi:uncharacterized protein (TIGR02145 family)